jgi:hypothetical protein
LGSEWLDEHGVDGLQVILGGQIHHREIFVIEIAMLFGRIAVALDEMVEHLQMRVDVAIEIHAMKPDSCRKPG